MAVDIHNFSIWECQKTSMSKAVCSECLWENSKENKSCNLCYSITWVVLCYRKLSRVRYPMKRRKLVQRAEFWLGRRSGGMRGRFWSKNGEWVQLPSCWWPLSHYPFLVIAEHGFCLIINDKVILWLPSSSGRTGAQSLRHPVRASVWVAVPSSPCPSCLLAPPACACEPTRHSAWGSLNKIVRCSLNSALKYRAVKLGTTKPEQSSRAFFGATTATSADQAWLLQPKILWLLVN